MTNTQEIAIPYSQSKIYEWTLYAILIGIAPLLLHQQWITGPIVNALLVATTLRIGAKQALLLAVIPSAAALAAGTLPMILAPTIPVIIIGNILLISGVQILKTKPFFGILTGAIVKFIWLTIASQWIVQFFLPEAILGKVTVMLSWPQLATALIGGFFVIGVINILKQKE
jgi:hypothetical protein